MDQILHVDAAEVLDTVDGDDFVFGDDVAVDRADARQPDQNAGAVFVAKAALDVVLGVQLGINDGAGAGLLFVFG